MSNQQLFQKKSQRVAKHRYSWVCLGIQITKCQSVSLASRSKNKNIIPIFRTSTYCQTFIWCDVYRANVFCFQILVPPRITKSPNDTIINEGENITLTCDAEGPPKPTFAWSNASEKVTIKKIISKNNKLELRNVRSAGRYHFTVTCIASNKGGKSTANATIEILGEYLKFTLNVEMYLGAFD